MYGQWWESTLLPELQFDGIVAKISIAYFTLQHCEIAVHPKAYATYALQIEHN